MTTLKFENRNKAWKELWIEPAAVSIELDTETEYRLDAKEDSFTIKLDSNNLLVLYLDYTFGFTLHKRPVSAKIPNPNPWKMDVDLSDIK